MNLLHSLNISLFTKKKKNTFQVSIHDPANLLISFPILPNLIIDTLFKVCEEKCIKVFKFKKLSEMKKKTTQ